MMVLFKKVGMFENMMNIWAGKITINSKMCLQYWGFMNS